MTQSYDLARPLDDVLDEMATLETRSGAPGAENAADPIAPLVAAIDRQTAALETRATPARRAPARTPAVSDIRARIQEARASLPELQGRRLAALRQVAEREEREARRGRADPLDREQRGRINAAIDADDRAAARELRQRVERLERENRTLRRPAGPDAVRQQPRQSPDMRTRAIRATGIYLRTGQEMFDGLHLRDIQRRAGFDTRAFAESGDAGSAGYLVVPERDTTMEQTEKPLSPLRALVTVRTIGTSEFQRIVNKHGINAYWDGETQDSGKVDLGLLKFPAMNMRTDPIVPLDMLEDSTMNLETYLEEESDIAFAEKESVAFYSGDGINKPKGLFTYPMVANASWAWGKVGYLATGVSGGFHATTPGDVVRQLPLTLKQGMRNGASWLAQRSTKGALRTIKDSTGQYLWANGDMSKGIPDTLDGYTVNEDEQMPQIGADAHALAFGNWKRAYIIADRVGRSMLRNPYLNPGNVTFHVRKRVGGGVQNFEAFKTIKFGTS